LEAIDGSQIVSDNVRISAEDTPELHLQAERIRNKLSRYMDRRDSTIKKMVVSILAESPKEGLDALEILERIRQKYGLEIERTSLSPQLSRLKNEGILANENQRWMLTVQK
jgi:hypothetical protein